MKRKKIFQVLMLAVFFSFLCLGVEWKLGGPFNLKIEDLCEDSKAELNKKEGVNGRFKSRF